MLIRAVMLGFLLWGAEFAALRLLGSAFFAPALAPHYLAFVISGVFAALIMYVFMHLLREVHGDEAEAAAAIALPGLGLGATALNFYPVLFPNLDPVLDGVLGAHLLLQTLSILGVGLYFTRLAPEDEAV